MIQELKSQGSIFWLPYIAQKCFCTQNIGMNINRSDVICYRLNTQSHFLGDKLALIYEANKVNQLAVQTPHGLTERIVVEKIVMQGETFAPLDCSVQLDTFGKQCLEQNKLLYQYKGEVGIPQLGLVDDLVSVGHCDVESVKCLS